MAEQRRVWGYKCLCFPGRECQQASYKEHDLEDSTLTLNWTKDHRPSLADRLELFMCASKTHGTSKQTMDYRIVLLEAEDGRL